MKKSVYLLLLLTIAASAFGQDTFYSIYSYDRYIPQVLIQDKSTDLQRDLFPAWYREHSSARDIAWLHQYDSSIVEFWNMQGDTILYILTELSGIDWQETEFDIHLVRYFTSVGSSEPTIIPIGGLMRGSLIESAPQGNKLQLNLIYQLARRMISQVDQPDREFDYGISQHPLMRYTSYRRDNLAMLLALTTAQSVLGLDSTRDAFASAFWKKQFPGREIFNRHFVNQWILTPTQTLTNWLIQEPYNSELVRITRPPRRPKKDTLQIPKSWVEGLPIKGRLGISVKIDNSGYLRIDTLDTYRLGYACGLQVGDQLRTVNRRRVRNHKQMVERILETLDDGGTTLQVRRNGEVMTLVMEPLALPVFDDDWYLYDDEYEETSFDSILPDSDYIDADN